MKKVLILILAVILSLSVFAMAACQQPCETHIDTNHDGICDVCEEAGLSVTHTDSNHDGKCDDCAGETTFEHVDAEHNGQCDVCKKPVAITHVDANKDGSCDVCQALVEHTHVDADNNGVCDLSACDYEFPWVANLAAAEEYVDGLYLNENATTAADYKVTTVVTVGGVEYSIVWSITSEVAGQTSVALGEVDTDKKQTIDVDEYSGDEVAYTLVGTISDAEGHSATVEYGRKVPKFVVATYEEYIAACKASSTETSITVRGYITAVNADPTSGSKASVWFRDAEGHGYYAYSPKVDASVIESRENILAEFPVGAEIIVSGTVGNKYGPQHNAGCTIVKTGNTAPAGWNTPVDQTEAFSNASGSADEALQPLYGSIVTLKGITMGTPNGLDYYFTINGKQYICRMNIYLTDEAGEQAMMDKWAVGGKANLTGLVTTYSNKFQIYPYGPECIEIVKEELTDEQIVERAKGALSFDTNHILAASEIELPAEIAGYEVSLAWALDKSYDFAAISEGKLVVSALPAEATTIKLVATIAKGEVSDTLEFEVDVDAAQVGAVTEVNLTSETLGLKNAYADGTATVAGVGFEYIELGDYGDGIQSRNKNGKTSTLWNTTAFPSDIVSVEITITDGKAGYDNANVFMLSFGATADALTEEISHNEEKGVLTYTYTPSAGARFFKMIKTNTHSSYYASIKITLAEVKEEGPLSEGKAYYLTVNQETVGKTLHFTGKSANQAWYLATTEDTSAAAKVFVEVVDGNYRMYFMDGESKTYIRMYERSAGSGSIELTTKVPSETYSYDETYKTLVLTVGSNKYYMGMYGTFETISCSNYSYITKDGNFSSVFTPAEGGTVVPPVEEHTCESKCPTCGLCLDAACTEEACANKCQGHTPAHECESKCPTCGKCLDEDCAESVCADKCEGHKPAAVVIDGKNYSEAQAEEALLALKADSVVTILANATITKEYTFVAANYTLGEGATLTAQANMVAPAGTKLTVSAGSKIVVESSATIDISALTQEAFATSQDARLVIKAGAKVIMPAYTEKLWKDQYLKVVIEKMIAESEVGAELVLGETKLTKTANGWEAEAPANTLTIEEAIALGKSQAHDKYTADKYYVTGVITAVYNTQYGNMYIRDDKGNTLTIYGTYSADGSVAYKNMTTKPQAGDTVTIYGIVGQFSNAPQIKNGWIVAHVIHEECTDYSEATCLEAAKCVVCGKAKGEALGHTEANAEGKCDRCGAALNASGKVATFTFGANKSGTHVDGNDMGTSKTYTDGAYSLALTGMSKVFGPAYDAKGNSAIKLGTSKAVGTFKFTVPENVTSVVIYVSGYKAKNVSVVINGGTAKTISTTSDSGNYTAIEIDTTTTKTITFATKSNYRCMIDAIEYIAG